MGISVEKFITEQEEKGRRSKLEPFKSDILLLKQKGFSQKQIHSEAITLKTPIFLRGQSDKKEYS